MERVCQKCFFLSKNAIYFNKNGQILCEIPHKKNFLGTDFNVFFLSALPR